MKKLIPTDHKGLYRDPNSNGIVNMDDEAYREYKKQKIRREKKLEIEAAREQRINKLESDVEELKDGVNQILEILKNGTN